jgi:hypothetical protein
LTTPSCRTILPHQVTNWTRKEIRTFDDDLQDMRTYNGVVVHFIGGGKLWLAEPDASAFEQEMMVFDGHQSSELPY